MTSQRNPITLNVHDTHFGIWQDDANDTSFQRDVFGPLVRGFRDRGWKVGPNTRTKKLYPTLSPTQRTAFKGTLCAEIELAGRSIQINFWASTWPIDNKNGRRYDFNKFERMSYMDQLRLRLELRRLVSWLETLAPLTIKGNLPRKELAMDRINRGYAESGHSDPELGRPICDQDWNCKSADGQRIEHGATVWTYGRNGRLRRGTAYYNINSMWWVVLDRYTLENISCRELVCARPENVRQKQNARVRRSRLEAELSKAVRQMDYDRAKTIKHILFGDGALYRIWSRKNDAYYRANYCGYTSDAMQAGLYTHDEAVKEVKRVSHILEAHGTNGHKIRFDEAA